jgi:hypothetical protein
LLAERLRAHIEVPLVAGPCEQVRWTKAA